MVLNECGSSQYMSSLLINGGGGISALKMDTLMLNTGPYGKIRYFILFIYTLFNSFYPQVSRTNTFTTLL